ncbi:MULTISPECIES: UDP-N-acetylmuramoyl-tripeptide--D-alanyl-D-alanine ligase [unclassified Roseofilum]|uniref:UDP-N-acetylmuramoyl-tripeptide--D-alanyl-D- alanine ligase n=1 Tax=unclassified Roseofilum TaxID=2620099 RepID=UPI000E92895D|nr:MULTISPECIES: UDP-N-acetylmuramoyl-tripeptide--D-alanyl-D-alanine ligase [unclassified Roseofilum]MBP0007253.1 UDP-N-acetylmuramoyl-tripeptide--D-alanyl-D-alanine ligase [Roseofilum sp. Belize Diploria]MBP0031896.1 UDP-N-acetylmuramoyl-tripeptide--D-alanyl-D-alanine ligase [Roseofilum sp. Belize BBD 4]HBQ99973.1 UDP-N-acetylmuramoyl-tripeptide--D-alanyl-D-alanine ligase [Cyanobacteria bacterium UBA11691]
MTFQVTLAQLIDVLGATVIHELQLDQTLEVTGISTDTRSLVPGSVFVALRGETFNGHDFVDRAIAKGAVASIVDTPVPHGGLQLVVEDTLVAYQTVGSWWRGTFDIPVIAVTGSCGKTTTKELIAAVLAHLKGRNYTKNILKTQKNFNNEIGVPKTLLELSGTHNYAVLEMAMRGRGQIALLSELAQPTIGVIVNVGTAHIGLLGSEQAIAEAKCELLEKMPKDSVAILNADNERLLATADRVWSGQTLTYGLSAGDCQGKLIDTETLELEGVRLPLPLPGRHNASNYLAAIAVAKVLGLDWKPLQAGLSVNLPSGRSGRYVLPNDIVLLDETYNAGIESMKAALELLDQTPGYRHIAVLGAMKELGENSFEYHRQLGEWAEQLPSLDGVMVLQDDEDVEGIDEGIREIPCEVYTTHERVIERLKVLMQPGDRILFKASHSVGLDRVVKAILEHYGLDNPEPS